MSELLARGAKEQAEKWVGLESSIQTLHSRIGLFATMSQLEPGVRRAQLYELLEWKTFFDRYPGLASAKFLTTLLAARDLVSQTVQRLQREWAELDDVFAQMSVDHVKHVAIRQRIITDVEEYTANLRQQAAAESRKHHAEWTAEFSRVFFGGAATPSPGAAMPAAPPPPPVPFEPPSYSNFPSRHFSVCPVWECKKWCLQPAGHGGPCYCENNHSGYW
jgi:hypothetical protein